MEIKDCFEKQYYSEPFGANEKQWLLKLFKKQSGSENMEFVNAKQEHQNVVLDIIHTTIKDIYPNYYPKGAVDFFLTHHSGENIKIAIQKNEVFLFSQNNKFVGTGSIRENEICRLFVLPQYQGYGYGKKIMDTLEKLIFVNYNEIKLDASLPAFNMYIKRGYVPTEYHTIPTKNGHFLCYHVMTLTRENYSSFVN